MIKLKKVLSIALLLVLVALVLSPIVPAHAIADPASPPAVNAVYAYDNCLEEGDLGVLVDYYIDYAVLPTVADPDDTATNAYLVSFIDTDGITPLSTVAPYTYHDSGYRWGLAWIYFTAAEVTTHGIDSANIALHEVWLTGNPTVASGWTGDPPKTAAGIDLWFTVTDPSAIIALRVLYYADQFELAWTLDMITETAIGSRLTVLGEAYFTNVIADLRTIAPRCFSSGQFDPEYVPVSYDTAFGATATSGTGGATLVGSPVTLAPSITIVNQGFELDDPPVGWTLVGSNATFAQSTAQVESGDYSGLVTRVGTNCYITQSVDPADHLGTTVTLGAWVYATVANRARIALDDDVGAVGYSAYHTGVAGWEWLTVAYAVNAAATDLQVRCYVDTGNTSAYFDNVALVEAANILDTGATVGIFTIDLANWTFGTIMDGTGTIAGTPIDLNPGTNTLTVTVAGTFTVVVGVVDTLTLLDASVRGTGFDLTELATEFGMSRWFLSGAIWVLITIIICAAVYRQSSQGIVYGAGSGVTKVVMIVFTVCVIGGTLLGLLQPMVAALLLIGCGAWIGYIIFFKSETLHKGFMFMVWMFVIVSLAGNILAGSTSIVATRLTADVTATEVNTITVASTDGFADAGIIVIGGERIGYPSKTATTFARTSVLGITTNPLVRGRNSTTPAIHLTGDTVRTQEAGFLNSAMDYKIARIVDSSGGLDFIALPVRLLDLIGTFFVLPLQFLGTDLAILTYIWGIVAIGMIVGFVLSVIGGRRV